MNANSTTVLPGGMDMPPLIPFGPHATCTLELCPIEYSLFRYRPSLAANAIFIALYVALLVAHLGLGLRFRVWWFTILVVLGCVSNIVGYGARILLWQNPFDFTGFLLQIIFIGSAPVFYSAAIYLTMTKTVERLDASLSRLTPKLYYVLFIVSDLGAGSLQAAGGAISTISEGASAAGVNLALAGLSFQVFSMLVFTALLADYLFRYFRSGNDRSYRSAARPLKVFVWSQGIAILLILVRCIYRVAELSEGYKGTLYHDEPLFIGLEGVLVVIAVIALAVAHPGIVFNNDFGARKSADAGKSEYSPLTTPGSEESGVELMRK